MKSFCLSLVLLLVGGHGVSFAARAESSALRSNTQIDAEKALGADEAQALSLAAGRIIAHVNEARAELHTSRKTAEAQLQKAIDLTRLIRENAPSYRVRTTIRAGEQTYTDTESRKDLIVAVADDFDLSALMLPVLRAKSESRGAVPVIGETVVAYTKVRLDARDAAKHLAAARRALSAGNASSADDHLRRLQSGVILEYFAEDVPLVRARESLTRSREYLLSGREEDAKVALHAASSALQTFKKDTPSEFFAQQVQTVQTELAEVTPRLNERRAALATIQSLSRRLTQLIERG